MGLNGGKIIQYDPDTGIPGATSYGYRSPADDTVPQSWRKGDVRYYQEVGASSQSKSVIKWVCIAAGTPGVWQLVRLPYMLPILQQTCLYTGTFGFGGETFMAPATADWNQATPPVNIVPMPPSIDLESASPGTGPTFLSLCVYLTQNSWNTPQPNGLFFRVRYITEPFSPGPIVWEGFVDQGAVGRFGPIASHIPAGAIDGGNALVASLQVNQETSGGAGFLAMVAVMTLYRDFSADFPS